MAWDLSCLHRIKTQGQINGNNRKRWGEKQKLITSNKIEQLKMIFKLDVKKRLISKNDIKDAIKARRARKE